MLEIARTAICRGVFGHEGVGTVLSRRPLSGKTVALVGNERRFFSGWVPRVSVLRAVFCLFE